MASIFDIENGRTVYYPGWVAIVDWGIPAVRKLIIVDDPKTPKQTADLRDLRQNASQIEGVYQDNLTDLSDPTGRFQVNDQKGVAMWAPNSDNIQVLTESEFLNGPNVKP